MICLRGTFVKNEQYGAEGRDDVYDFYFCDSRNDAIRLLTPEGIVKTYAGGSANTHSDGYTYGNENLYVTMFLMPWMSLSLTVGGETKFACVDGPDFDGHLVDFDEAMARSTSYREFERHAHEEACNLFREVR